MTRTRARTCGRKQRHATKAEAREQLEALVRKGANRNQHNVYKCRFCGCWHVGHKIGSGGRRR